MVSGPLGLRVRQLHPFIPLGTRIGSFLIFAEAAIGGIFTDNVLATPTAHSDYAFEFAPEARLESDWARHAFVAEFMTDRIWHNTFSVEDDKVYAAILRGRFDVDACTTLELELGKAQTHEGRNATSITNIGGFRTTVQEEQIADAVVGQAIQQADVRDYRENELTMRGTY